MLKIWYIAVITFFVFTTPTFAMTKPMDSITILKITGQDTTEKYTVYSNPFAQLVLSPQERNQIAYFNSVLDKDWHQFSENLYGLTHLRLHADTIQVIRFENKMDDTILFHLHFKQKCVNSLSGNGGPIAVCESY